MSGWCGVGVSSSGLEIRGLLLLTVFSGLCEPVSPSLLGQFWASNIAVLGDTGKLLGSINDSISLLSLFSIWKSRGELSGTCSPLYRSWGLQVTARLSDCPLRNVWTLPCFRSGSPRFSAEANSALETLLERLGCPERSGCHEKRFGVFLPGPAPFQASGELCGGMGGRDSELC